jgi:tetratricopeptide (TPR) repeat protein
MRFAMRLAAVLLLSLLPVAAHAVGSDETEPPTPTETTTKCTDGQVWDEKTKACVAPDGALLDNDTLFRAVRELAWAGRPDEALVVLAAMTEGDSDRVLTYRGFALRKSGDLEGGLAAYERALQQNPANILARSYFGQMLVEMNEMQMASLQLDEIRARGGAGTWAETSLAHAIATGETATY